MHIMNYHRRKSGGIYMTRLDVFIRKLLLDHLSLSYLELTPHQEDLLNQMILESYENQAYCFLNIDEKVNQISEAYRARFFSA